MSGGAVAEVPMSAAKSIGSPAAEPSERIPTDEELESYILSGRITHLPKRKPKVVRIFLSSTFTDMYIERNALLKYVYPRLQQYCTTKYDLEFQVVDMRWGVRSTASNDHSGATLCMNELKICQEASLGPNFVLLLGQRYGTRHVPPVIPVDEFSQLVTALVALKTPEVDMEFLHRWYLSDTNSVPPMRRLQPLDIMKVDHGEFSDSVDPRLRQMLRAAADWCLSKMLIDGKRHRSYFWSVTEEEVYNGILSTANPNDHCLCFVREIKDIDYKSDKAGRFVDMMDTGEVDREAQDLLSDMKQQVYSVLDAENMIEIPTVQWCDKGGTNEDVHADYLRAFCDVFFNKVVEMIDKAARASNLTAKLCDSSLLSEVLEHGNQARTKLQTFHGREDVLHKVKAYIENKDHVEPLTIFGGSGFGKTSIMAVASTKVFEWLQDGTEVLVIRRFLGTTPDSTNIELLLRSIAAQAEAHWNIRLPRIDDPLTVLNVLFRYIPKSEKLVLFLDSLDQLSAAGKAHTLKWLPHDVPANVKLIVSTLPEEHDILSTIRSRMYSESLFVEVETLDHHMAFELFVGWLSSASKMLAPEQLSVIREKLQDESEISPLFVKLLFDLLKDFPSYMNVDRFRELLENLNSPRDCIRHVITELRIKHGERLVDTAFAFLHLSNQGLTENEIVHLLSLNEAVLSEVFQFHMPPLRRLPAVLWTRIRHDVSEYIVERDANGTKVLSWYHRQFLECGKVMFIEDCPEETLKELRQTMVDYFMGVWAKGRQKPFRYTDSMRVKLQLPSSDSAADRFVPEQPNILSNGKVNRRKFSQLPSLLVAERKIDLFLSELLGNMAALSGMLETHTWTEFVPLLNNVGGGEFDDSLSKLAYWVLIKCLVLCCNTAYMYPSSLGPLLAGRMLPFYGVSALIDGLLSDIYSKGLERNAFVVRHNQLEGLGDYLVFEIANQHIGPCYGLRLIDCYREKYVFSISKRAVLIDITAVGDIAMSYTPQLLDGDHFTLMSSADKLYPKFLAASLQLVPKVYVFSVEARECTGNFDCRQIAGCEDMVIQDMLVIEINHREVAAVWGSRCHGLLLFDLWLCEFLYHYTNEDYILSVHFRLSTLAIIHPGQVVRLRADYKDSSVQVEMVDKLLLAIPRNVSVTAAKATADAHFLATSDCKLFVWRNNKMSAKSLILDSPAHSLTSTDKGLVACTASSVYAINDDQDGYPVIEWRVLRRLDWAGYLSKPEVAGYRLGHMSVMQLTHRDNGTVVRVAEDLNFVAHAKPITGILLGMQPRSFLTCSADGSIRILDGTVQLNKYIKTLSNFDLMEFNIDFVCGNGLYGLSVAKTNRVVAVWNLETGRITHRLRHDGPDELRDAVVVGNSVVTANASGLLFMWNLNTNANEPPVWTRTIPNLTSVAAKSDKQLLILSTNAVLELSLQTGEVMTTSYVRHGKIQLCHSWIPEGIAAAVDAEPPAVELITYQEKPDRLFNLSGLGTFGSSITGLWYYLGILVLTFPRHVVFYSCDKNTVLASLQLGRPVLMKSRRNVVGVRSGLHLIFFEIKSDGVAAICQLGKIKLLSAKDMAVLSSDGRHCLVANLPKILHLYRLSDMTDIAVYACYSDIECVALTDDSQHALVGMTDTRLLCFLIVDHKCPDHKGRNENILCKPSTSEEFEARKKTLIGAGSLAAVGVFSDLATEPADASMEAVTHVNINEFQFIAGDAEGSKNDNYATQTSCNIWKRTRV